MTTQDRLQVMARLGLFSRVELKVSLGVPSKTVNSIIDSYLKRGLIKKVKQGTYAALDVFGLPVLNRYQIASRITPDAVVVNHSAFEVYGTANQAYFEVYVATKTRQRDFSFENVRYRFFAPKVKLNTIERDGVTLTTPEQTIIDTIHDLHRLTGLEELLNCLEDLPPLDETELLAILARYNSGILYQKTGYILEVVNDELELSEHFFNECQKRLPKRINYLTNSNKTYSRKWKLYTPELAQYINQGWGI